MQTLPRSPRLGPRSLIAAAAALAGALVACSAAPRSANPGKAPRRLTGNAGDRATASSPPTPTRDSAMPSCCAIVELRQYTLYPGKRDTLISLFDREFVEPQEAVGMQVIGQFRDLNDPNRFVWFRGFADMTARHQALTDFYTGPVWKAHRDAANATMYDSDNVLLLRPARADSGFPPAGAQRAAPGGTPGPDDFLVVTTYHVAPAISDAFARWFVEHLRPLFARSGANVLAELVSDRSENTFPRLPVRASENVFVWVASFESRAAYDRYLERIAADARWSGELFATLHKQITGFPETVLLAPTPRSQLGHRPVAAANTGSARQRTPLPR